MINIEKLHKELSDAGIEISGCNSAGVVWDLQNKQIQSEEAVKVVIDAHDPAPVAPADLRQEYFEAGITVEDMLFALWNKIMQSDSVHADVLQAIMDGVDALAS